MKKFWYLYLIVVGIALISLVQSCVRANSQEPNSQPILGFRAYCDKAEFYYGQVDYRLAYAHLDTAIQQAEKEQDWLWVGRMSVRYVQILAEMTREKMLTDELWRQKVDKIQQTLSNQQAQHPALEGYIIVNSQLLDFNADSALIYSARLLAIAEKEQEWGLVFSGNLPIARFLFAEKRFEELKNLAAILDLIYNQHLDEEIEAYFAFPASDYSDYSEIMVLAARADTDTETIEKIWFNLSEKLAHYKHPISINLLNTYDKLANLRDDKKDYRYSVQLREKSLRLIAQKQQLSDNDSMLWAAVLGGLARDYQQINQPQTALSFADKSIAIYEKIDYTSQDENFIQQAKSALIDAYISKIKLFIDNQQWENIPSLLKTAKTYLKSIENTKAGEGNKVQLYRAEIDFYSQQKKNEQALKLLKELEVWLFKIQDINTAYLLDYYQTAAQTYMGAGQAKKGLEMIQRQYVIIQSQPNPVYSIYGLPSFDDLIDKNSGLQIANSQLNCLSAMVKQDSSYWVNDSFVQSYWQTAKLTTRLFEYNFIHLNSQQSKADFIQLLYATYDQVMEIGQHLHQKTQDTAYLHQVWRWSEQTKSMFLLQMLCGEERQRFAGVPDSIILTEQQLRRNWIYYEQKLMSANKADTAQYNRIKNTLSQIQTQQTAFNTQLQTDYPKYHQLQYASPIVEMGEVQKTLQDSSQMLSFWVGNEYIYIFAVGKQHSQLRKYPIEAAYNTLNALIPLYADPKSDGQQLQKLSFSLYQNYLLPSIDSQTNELVIVADGLFTYLPFEALVASDLGKNSAREWDYLLQRYKFSYHYSASLYQTLQTRESQASNWQILGMAADYQLLDDFYKHDSILAKKRPPQQKKMRQTLLPLKGAADEINKLPEIYRGYFVTGAAATEYEFVQNAPYYGILHLAMHNVVNAEIAEQSGLVFTENVDTLNDNFLQSEEIKRLDLAADLVILPACETGFGKYKRGEAGISVGRSFIYAGASSLLMGLWSPNDYTTPKISLKFYEYLQQGFSKNEALQRSKLDYLQTAKGEAAHPALWASLLQVGNTKNIVPASRITIWWYFIPLAAVALVGLWARNALKQRRKF